MITDEMIAYEFGASNEDRRWDRWTALVERLLGHDLDGDQDVDGYSIDFAFDEFRKRITPAQYVATVKSNQLYKGVRR
jgi:hypothetical protein